MKKHTVALILIGLGIVFACAPYPKEVETNPAVKAQRFPAESFDSVIQDNVDDMMKRGREIFRYDTFGSESFWGDQLKLHEAIAGEKQGGRGPGLSPKQALQLGLKVDQGKVPSTLLEVIKGGAVSLENPETTLELLRANAVVGVTGFFDKKDKRLRSVGLQCAFCHSTVDDSFARGIGRRLDGWPNRDLNVGAIVELSPDLKPMADLLKTDEATVRKVLLSWGPGKYDAELNQDGKAFRPDGKSGATVLPAAFGLAGVHLHTYTGWGSVTYWNAYVATTQMVGQGTFFDPRLKNQAQFPIGAAAGFGDMRPQSDLVTEKLGALHFYQLAIPAPTPPKKLFNKEAAARGKEVFNGKAKCASCHVPPLFTEPGWPLHTPEEIGIDDFQANRSPEKRYRTTPLRGLFTRMRGGFYHDGRFATLDEVVNHYNAVKQLNLTGPEHADLIEYLKSL
jgi:hypothetical protein